MDKTDSVEVHAIIHGQVQGVGFRFTARHLAVGLGITGSVKNLPDGTVELYAVSSKEQLEEFFERLKVGAGRIDHIESHYATPGHDYNGFQITY